MTNQEMKDALLAANTALVEKIGKQPYMGLKLTLDDDKWKVGGAYIDQSMRESFFGPSRETVKGAFDAVMRQIAKMPSEGERDLRQFQKKVAEAIDFGNEKGIEAQWLNPLVETARSLAENALTYEAAE